MGNRFDYSDSGGTFELSSFLLDIERESKFVLPPHISYLRFHSLYATEPFSIIVYTGYHPQTTDRIYDLGTY